MQWKGERSGEQFGCRPERGSKGKTRSSVGEGKRTELMEGSGGQIRYTAIARPLDSK